MYAIGKKLPTVTAKRGRDPSERQPSTQKTSCQVRTSVRVNRLRNSIKKNIKKTGANGKLERRAQQVPFVRKKKQLIFE